MFDRLWDTFWNVADKFYTTFCRHKNIIDNENWCPDCGYQVKAFHFKKAKDHHDGHDDIYDIAD